MSLLFLAFVALFESLDLLKLLGIVAAAVALFLIARRVGSGGESISAPAMTVAVQPPPQPETIAEPEGPDPDQPGYIPAPEEESPGPPRKKIQITDWNFTGFDIRTGPPDRNVLADELHIQLYDPSTGRRWVQSYFVATPKGLEKVLRYKNWNYVFLGGLLLDHYDLKEVQTAIREEVGAVEAQRGEVTPVTSEGSSVV